MLLPGEKHAPPPANTLHEQGIACLQSGQWSVGYALLAAAEQAAPGEVPVCYNLALCCMQAKEYSEAVQWLDEGLARLKAAPPQGGPHPGAGMQNNAIAMALAKQEAAANGYTAPLHIFLPRCFARETKLRFMRLLVDACAGAGLWQRVSQLAGQLHNHGFANVTLAVQQGQTKGFL